MRSRDMQEAARADNQGQSLPSVPEETKPKVRFRTWTFRSGYTYLVALDMTEQEWHNRGGKTLPRVGRPCVG